eukprot:scaffold2974_cov288-Chaetoceros_neogracile.AAC.9
MQLHTTHSLGFLIVVISTITSIQFAMVERGQSAINNLLTPFLERLKLHILLHLNRFMDRHDNLMFGIIVLLPSSPQDIQRV